MIPESFIEELRYRTDIAELIGQYLPLKRAGRNMMGLCPFHSERSPSFAVYQDTQSFYCFGCGSGGDAITFIKKIENLGYVDAIKFLAQRAGITIPEEAAEDRTSRLRMRVLELNRVAARYYNSVLTSEMGKPGVEYLRQRGLTPKTITKFGLGYAPDGWDNLLKHLTEKGFTLEEMVAAAVVSTNSKGGGYDVFRERVIYPIIDIRGNVIGFGGRAFGDKKPKYLNSSDTPAFKKSRNLYAMNFAKATKQKYLLLAEGYMDVIAISQAGFDNTVATLGTALTSEQARLVSQYVNEVVICYDSDEAGQKATERATAILKEVGVNVRVLTINGAKDPDEYIKKFGADKFKLLIEQSEASTEFKIKKLESKYDTNSNEGKVAYLKEFCSFMAGLNNTIEAEIYITKTARELSVSKDVLLDNISKIKSRKRRGDEKKERRNVRSYVQNSPTLARDVDRAKFSKYAGAEDKIIYTLMKYPEYFRFIRDKLTAEDFVTKMNGELYRGVAGRLSEGLSTEPIMLSSILNEEQMSRLSWIMANYGVHQYTKEELIEFVDVVLSYKSIRSTQEVAEMSDIEWAEYMKNLSKGKK